MPRKLAEHRPVPANRANEYLSNLVLEGGRHQHYDQARTRIAEPDGASSNGSTPPPRSEQEPDRDE